MPLAVCETAENLANVECGVKWPNDVWVRGRKLAGILIEGRPEEDWAVIGVGLNVDVPAEAFPDELRDNAISLEGVRVQEALAALNGSLPSWIDAPPERVLAEFRRRDQLAGRRISWDGGAGTAMGVDDSGHLLVRTGEGETATLGAGEVHLAVETRG